MTTTESEVATLRMLFETITDGRLRMRLRGIDVTEREQILLRREIAALEKTLARTGVTHLPAAPCNMNAT